MADDPPVVVGKTYDFVLWLMPKAEKFSRAYRFSRGERLIAHGLDLLLLVVESAPRAGTGDGPPRARVLKSAYRVCMVGRKEKGDDPAWTVGKSSGRCGGMAGTK